MVVGDPPLFNANFHAVLLKSMVRHTCESNALISILIDIPSTFIRRKCLLISFLWCIHALGGSALSSLYSGSAYLSSLITAWSCLHSPNREIPKLFWHFMLHYPPTSIIISNNSTGSASSANVFNIIKLRVLDDQPAPVSLVNTASFRCTNSHLPSRESLRVAYQLVVEMRLPWSRRSWPWSLTSGMSFHLLIWTRLGRVE